MNRAVATIKDVDEHGPIIEWHQHWAELKGRTLYLTEPAQAVDVDAVRAVIEQTREYYERTDDRRTAYALENVLSDIYETLTAALPNAQEGTPDAAR